MKKQKAVKKQRSESLLDTSFSYEQHGLIAGVDEAGRGALAGPVVAASVIFKEGFDIIGLDDSKKLSPKERNELSLEIKEFALAYGIGYSWQKMIDKENILQATLIAMARSLDALHHRSKIKPEKLLIDGTQIIPEKYFPVYTNAFDKAPNQQAIIDGDALVPSISAASVLAKVTRDDLMTKFGIRYPEYNFGKHFGYGSKEHREALQVHKHCRIHRLSFRGVLPIKKQEQLSLFD